MGLKPYQIAAVNGRRRFVLRKPLLRDDEQDQFDTLIAAQADVAKAARKLVGLVDGGQETLEDRNEALAGVRRSLQVLDALGERYAVTPAGAAAREKGA